MCDDKNVWWDTEDELKENTNVLFGFSDMTQWENNNPGNIQFSCEYCGIYTASKPRCGRCEE